jgi:hypothetical protein
MDGLLSASSLTDIPLEASLEAKLIVGINKNGVGIHLSKLRVMEREDPLNDDNVNRFDALHLLVISAMKREVVHRSVHGVPIPKGVEVVTQELCLKGVRMIVISSYPRLQGNVRLVVIVGIEGDDLHPLWPTDSKEIVRKGGLATGGSTSD